MSELLSDIYNVDLLQSQNLNHIYYSAARPGSGKTEWAIEQMSTVKTKWLYVVDRREAIRDRTERIKQKDQMVIVSEIHKENVASRIWSWNFSAEGRDEHQILMITHAGLMVSDLSGVSDWSIIIDEVLDPWMFGEVSNTLTADIFSKYFEINERWLTIKADAFISDLRTETTLNDQIPNLYSAAKRGKVAVTIDNFDTDKSWQWFTVWNFDQLRIFNRCYILANSFLDSMMHKLMKTHGGFKFSELSLPSRHYQSRKVVIRYFDGVNNASQSFFKSDEGQEALKLISAHYRTTPNDRIWTKNDNNMELPLVCGYF
jgi:hypothetical protein